jgi:hypothetical protein
VASRWGAGPVCGRGAYLNWMLVTFAAALSLVLPSGWQVAHPALLEACTNPINRFAVTDGRNLVDVQEELGLSTADKRRTPPRPARFRVNGKPHFLTCCAPARRQRAWQLSFRQHGRVFNAYVYGDARAALAILDSLHVGRAVASSTQR